jgi:hypothetical protein
MCAIPSALAEDLNSAYPTQKNEPLLGATTMPHQNQLNIPAAAINDPKALEMLRVWAAGGVQHVSINVNLWNDPANWGIMLVDLANHVARAYAEKGGLSEKDALKRLRLGFDAEWSHPTDQ